MDENPEGVDQPEDRRWPPQLQRTAAIGWSSFLAASIGTMIVFAALDPQLIIDGLDVGDPDNPPFWLNRTGIYTIGFFVLWAVAAVSAWFATVLTRSEDA